MQQVGFLSAFGQGQDGPYAVSGGNTATLDTGDTPNAPLGNPFFVTELNPDDDYLGSPQNEQIEYDSVVPFELEIESLTVSSSSTLDVIGVNPILFRVTGLVQVSGTIDIAGGAGGGGGGGNAVGGTAGDGSFDGGCSRRGSASCTNAWGSNCQRFSTYLNACSAAKKSFPNALNGIGPGRGYPGGEIYNYDLTDDRNTSATGTGGGGAGPAFTGGDGENRMDVAGTADRPAFVRIRAAFRIRRRGGSRPRSVRVH